MERGETTPFFLAARALLALLTGAAAVSGATLYTASNTLFAAVGWREVVRGRAAAGFEDAYEENLALRAHAVHGWGAVKYALFNTGSDGVVIGKDGWLFTDEEYETPPNAAREEAAKAARVAEIRDYLGRHGIALMVALIPAKSRVYAEYTRHPHPPYRDGLYARFRGALLGERILVPDMLTAFERAKPETALFMRTDTHWTPEGAALAAGVLAAAKRNRAEAALEKKEFVTAHGKRTRHGGDLLRFIPTGIFRRWVGPGEETYISRQTRERGEVAASAAALLGGQTISVALIGTSYSQQTYWNFEGALKDALEADVVNIAGEGKGPLAPMAKFLKETDFAKTRLKLVIWEIPERFIPVEYPEVTFPDLGAVSTL